jgi:hypothetical protein
VASTEEKKESTNLFRTLREKYGNETLAQQEIDKSKQAKPKL